MKPIKTVPLAIVIPTLNEENYIGILLDSIIHQSVWPEEVAVVDAFSEDTTEKEVRKRMKDFPHLKFYQIPKSTISKQRNFGVSKTKAPHILFLDADTKLDDQETLEKYMREVLKKNPDVASATNLPLPDTLKNAIIFIATDKAFRILKRIWPMAMGVNMYFKRSTFESIGGFDEKLRFAEDHELVQRAVKNGGKFIFLDNPKIYTSTRRLESEGRRKYVIKMLKSLYYILTKGYRNNPTEYQFGHFDNKKK